MRLITKLSIATLLGLWAAAPKIIPAEELTGKVEQLSPIATEGIPTRNATVRIPRGTVTAQIYETQIDYQVGDQVLLYEDKATGQMTVAAFARTKELLQLFVLFLVIVVLVSGVEGLRSLLGLVVSFAVIFAFILPQIAYGANSLMVTLIGAMMIMFFSYYLTHGFSTKTTVALLGTIGSLVVTSVLAFVYTKVTRLSGFGSEEASFLLANMPESNMQSLLLSGMIIATLGVLDDVTISQASVVAELRSANRKLGFMELFVSGMRVGRDHIASVVNTLVLVYAGTALPLLLLFTNSEAGALELLNYEAVAEEIVRTLVGSIGLVTAVPITTFIAAFWQFEHKQS